MRDGDLALVTAAHPLPPPTDIVPSSSLPVQLSPSFGHCKCFNPIGETVRPVWGLIDKCYPVTIQRRRVWSGKKQDSEAMTPKATGELNDAAPPEGADTLFGDEGDMRSPEEEAGNAIPSPIPAGKEVSEEEEVAGTPGWEENKKVRKEIAVYTSEASEVDITEESSGGWVPQLLRRFWMGWVPGRDTPKTQSHE
ncbi:uncharacterized protein LOC130856826 isoform X2 [Hippopotamus amphibius kiboko]|uniref:uncharacterized protein LOC130856826 isoform X2 n=1 Tax=Hippopotamus amphibius kiboko TaxID=575201 RepID=UPI002592C955|nr:uncharacterized protein LOC130856826 isoform X2 [Hippopotamus amphibius kiboko]